MQLRKGDEREEIGPAEVRERYGVAPGQVSDFIALRGDPSDGLPGAPGIGAKTAAELLGEYGSLERALEAARAADEAPGVGKMRPRTARRCASNAELLARSSRSRRCSGSTSSARPTARPTSRAGRARRRSLE